MELVIAGELSPDLQPLRHRRGDRPTRSSNARLGLAMPKPADHRNHAAVSTPNPWAPVPLLSACCSSPQHAPAAPGTTSIWDLIARAVGTLLGHDEESPGAQSLTST